MHPRPDLAHLLRLMSIRSELVQEREAGASPEPEEAPPPPVLDTWLEARVQQQEEVLAAAPVEAPEPPPAPEEQAQAPAPEPHTAIQPDEPLVEPEAVVAAEISHLELDELAEEEVATPQVSEGDQLPSSEAEPELPEGRAEDFQALLDYAPPRPEPEPEPPAAEEEREGLLPADGDVILRVRSGPRAGAEFGGKTTLAGANGIYCLIDSFDLPIGTHARLTLMAPKMDDQLDVANAVVKGVRKAPGDSTEVHLVFAERPEVTDFVARHFGEKPSRFSLLDRLRAKHNHNA